MMLRHVRPLGAATFLLAMAVLVPESAIAADPLLPTAAAGVTIVNDSGGSVTSGDTDPGFSGYSSITEFQLQLVKAPSGPGESLTSVTIQRPRGQYDQPFNLGMGKSLKTALIQLRKPAAGGQADWFFVRLDNAKVSVDEERTSKGATTSTEILVLSFTKADVYHRVQTAQGYTQYAEVPPQFDIKDNVQLVPPPPPPPPTRPTVAGVRR